MKNSYLSTLLDVYPSTLVDDEREEVNYVGESDIDVMIPCLSMWCVAPKCVCGHRDE